MCEKDNNDKIDLFLKSAEIGIIGNQMVQNVREENKQLGVPLVYSVDDKIFYELADGTITKNTPFKK